MKLGGIYVDITGKTTGLKKDLSQAEGMVDRSSKDMQSTISRISFAQIGVAALAFAGTYAYAMKKSIEAASDLQEVQGKFDVVFKGQEKVAESWSKTLVQSYMMSQREAKQYLSSVQDLLVPMGMQSDAAARMSNEVVKLSADLGSFNNLPTAQVMGDIQSALVGNFETMKKYGVVLNEAVVTQKALDMGLVSNKNELNANIKAQVAYKLMVEGSAAAVGDADRTSGSYANQMKKLTARFEDIKSVIGDQVLPIVTKFVKEMNDWIDNNPDTIKALAELASSWTRVAAAIAKVIVNAASYRKFYAIGSPVSNGKFAPSIVPKGIGLPERIENPGKVEVYDAEESVKAVIAANNAKAVSVKQYVDRWIYHEEQAATKSKKIIEAETAAIDKMNKELSDGKMEILLGETDAREKEQAVWLQMDADLAKDKLEIYDRNAQKIIELQKNHMGVFESVTKAGTVAAYGAFSDFIDPLSDKFTDLSDLWKSVTQSMSASFADAISQMAVDWAITEGWKFLTSSSGGGGILDTVLSWFGTGAWNVDKDQVAGLHEGEMVLPKSVADAIRNSGEASRQPNTGSGAASAGFSWGGLKDLVTKGIGGMMLEDMGADSPWAKKANTVTSTAVSMFSPIPFSGTAAGVVAGLLAEKAADKANVRSLEALRDLATSHYGFMGGLSALAESGGHMAAIARQAANYEDRFSGRDSGNGGYGGDQSDSPGGPGGFKYGGISTGPESGYSAKLHGTELVVSQKKDVPVKMGGGPMNINLHLDGKVIAKWLFDYTKTGHKSVHGRGIVYG